MRPSVRSLLSSHVSSTTIVKHHGTCWSSSDFLFNGFFLFACLFFVCLFALNLLFVCLFFVVVVFFCFCFFLLSALYIKYCELQVTWSCTHFQHDLCYSLLFVSDLSSVFFSCLSVRGEFCMRPVSCIPIFFCLINSKDTDLRQSGSQTRLRPYFADSNTTLHSNTACVC